MVFELDNFPSGEVNTNSYFYTIRLNNFSPLDYFRFVTEGIFVMLNSWFLYCLLKDYTLFTVSEFERRNNQIQDIENRPTSAVLIFLNIKKGQIEQWENICVALVVVIKGFIVGVYKVILCIFKFTFRSIHRCVDIASVTICIILIVKWIQIITEDSFNIDENGVAQNSFEYSYIMQKYLQDYRMLYTIGINICFFIKTISFLPLSYKLSIFYETIKNSSYDLIFFTSSFILIMLGYSLMGNFLFGLYQFEFKSVAYSFLTIFELLCGGYYYEDILYYNKIVLYIYGVSLTFMSVILLNFILAIISSYYFEYYANQGDLNANFVKLFLKNFIGKEEPIKPKTKQWLIKRIYNSAVRYVRNWVWSIKSKESTLKETARYKKIDRKYYSNEIKLNISKRLRNVMEGSIENDDSFMERNVSNNKIKLHFWVSLIDNVLSSRIK